MLFRLLTVVIEIKLFHFPLIFSEEALIKYRVLVEVEYFIALCDAGIPQLSGVAKSLYADLRKIYEDFFNRRCVMD